jgi:DNA-binding transcriptional MerR regulator
MKRLLWPGEVARELGVCAKTVNRWADAGAVETIRDAKGRRHFKPEAIQILAARLGLALPPSDSQEAASNGGAR